MGTQGHHAVPVLYCRMHACVKLPQFPQNVRNIPSRPYKRRSAVFGNGWREPGGMQSRHHPVVLFGRAVRLQHAQENECSSPGSGIQHNVIIVIEASRYLRGTTSILERNGTTWHDDDHDDDGNGGGDGHERPIIVVQVAFLFVPGISRWTCDQCNAAAPYLGKGI